jgi:hypothetical protein
MQFIEEHLALRAGKMSFLNATTWRHKDLGRLILNFWRARETKIVWRDWLSAHPTSA